MYIYISKHIKADTTPRLNKYANVHVGRQKTNRKHAKRKQNTGHSNVHIKSN